MIKVTVIYRNKETLVEYDHKLMVKEALTQIGYSTETHLVIRNGQMVTEDERLHDGDVIKLVAVISGG